MTYMNSKNDMFNDFLETRGNSVKKWVKDHNKKKCPECHSLHQKDAEKCKVCGWN